MADDYVFNDHTDAEKVREAVQNGTDGSGRPILRNVVTLPSEFNEDAAHSSGESGLGVLAVRNDTLASLVDTDGDYAPLQVDQDGAAYATISQDLVDNGNAAGTQGLPVMGYHQSSPATVSDGQYVRPLHGEQGEYVINALQSSEDSVEAVQSPDNTAIADGSGSIASASTSESVFASKSDRKYLIVQNLSDTDMYVNVGAAAGNSAGSMLLPASGGSIVFEDGYVPTEAVNIWCSASSKDYTAKQA